MNTIFGTVLRAVGAAVTSTVSPLTAAMWTARPVVAAAPAVKPPVDLSTTRADGRYDLDPYSELEKGRLLEWWILVADK
jgi:hypothetical protein